MGKRDKFNPMRVTPIGVGIGFLVGLLLAGITFIDTAEDFKVGQTITNGYCSGVVAAVLSSEYMVLNAECGAVTFNRVYFKKSTAKELK